MIKLMKKYLKQFKGYLLIFILMNLLAAIIKLLNPYLMGKFIDYIIEKRNIRIINKFAFSLTLLMIIEILTIYFNTLISTKLKAKISYKLNFDIIEHVKRLPIRYTKTNNSVYLSEKINLDSNVITNFILDHLFNLFTNILIALLVLYVLFKINYTLFIFVSINIIIYSISYKFLKNPLRKCISNLKENQNIFSAQLYNQLYYIPIIKLNSWYKYFAKKLNDSFVKLYKSLIKFTRTSLLYSSLDTAINRLFNIFLVLYGGIQIINNKLSIGDLTIISNYYFVLFSIFSSIFTFGKIYEDCKVSYIRIKDIIDLPVEHNGTVLIKSIDTIEIKDLCFSYDKKILFKNFNYKFSKGNLYFIIGKNGIGKSTLINILIGLSNNYSGKIKYNNINLKDLDMISIRKNLISISEQECTLLNESILNNLMVDYHYKIEDIKKLLGIFNMNKFIDKLPQKLDTMINDNSNNISGGEKQKLSLIRSILKMSDILIFDEPTSAMDNVSIENFKKLLLKLKKGKIIIVITHDTTLLNIESKIIDLNIGVENYEY